KSRSAASRSRLGRARASAPPKRRRQRRLSSVSPWMGIGCCRRQVAARERRTWENEGNFGARYLPRTKERLLARLYDQLTIFGGNSNPELTDEICNYLGLPRGRADVF